MSKQRLSVSKFLSRHFFGEFINNPGSGFYANIGSEQDGFNVFNQLIIYIFFAQHQVGNAITETGTGPAQALF